MYVYYCRTYEKAVSGGGEREKGGHVLKDTKARQATVTNKAKLATMHCRRDVADGSLYSIR